jgi:hypothetical protein
MRAVKRHFADALTPEQFEALADILRVLRDHLHPELRDHLHPELNGTPAGGSRS